MLTISGVILTLLMLLAITDSNVALFYWVNDLGRLTGSWFWANVTTFGEGMLILSLLGVIAVRQPAAAWAVLIAAIAGTLIVHGLKEALSVPRPAAVLPPGSFQIIGDRLLVVSTPSGHTATMSALAGIMMLQPGWRHWRWLWLVPVVLVALSRLAVGAHWPIDTLAGMLTGMVIAVLSIMVARRWPLERWLAARAVFFVFGGVCAGAYVWLRPLMAQAWLLHWLIGLVGIGGSILGLWQAWQARMGKVAATPRQ